MTLVVPIRLNLIDKQNFPAVIGNKVLNPCMCKHTLSVTPMSTHCVIGVVAALNSEKDLTVVFTAWELI